MRRATARPGVEVDRTGRGRFAGSATRPCALLCADCFGVEALVDVALSNGWARIAFARLPSFSAGQAAADSQAEAALNLTLRNHNLPQWALDDAQVVVATPLTSAAMAAAAASAASSASARLALLATSCASGEGSNDPAAAAASVGAPSAAPGQPALRLPPAGSLCVRVLPPAMEAARGSNVTAAGEAWAAGPGATARTAAAAAAREWEGLSYGPVTSLCGANCSSGVLRQAFVWEYVLGPDTAPPSGAGVRRFLETGTSNRTRCGAPTALLPPAGRSLVLGQSTPLTGAAASLGVGMQQGMIKALRGHPTSHGRRLVLLSLDDGYVPSRTAANARKLVEEVGIFAMVGSVGSATGAAVVDYLNAMRVPHIGQLSGANVFRYPPRRYTINVRAAYADEAAAMVDEVTQFGLSKVALIAQNDTYGEAGLVGLQTALSPRGLKLHSVGYYRASDIAGTTEGAIAAINGTDDHPEAVVLFALTDAAAIALPILKQQMPSAAFLLASPISPSALVAALAANPRVGSTGAAVALMDGIFIAQAVWPPRLEVGDSTREAVAWVEQEGVYAASLVALGLDAIPSADPGQWTGEDLLNAISDRSVFRVSTGAAGGGDMHLLGPYSVNCSQGMRSVIKTRISKPPAGSAAAGPGEEPFVTTITGEFKFSSCGVLDTSAIEAAEPLVFGQVVPFSALNDWAEQMVLGVRAAFDDANRDGGINGRYVQLVTADDGYNPALASIEVRRMVEEQKVLAVVGTVGTGTALAMLDYLEPLHVPLVAPVSGARELRRPFRQGVVNIRASYDDEAFLLVDTAVRAGRTRCSVFFQDDGFGRSGLEGARVALWNNGLAIHSNASYDRAVGNTSAALREMSLRTPPEAVVIFAVTAPAIEFICASSELPAWGGVWYLLPSVVGENFGEQLGDCAARVRVFVSRTLPDPGNATVGVVATFQKSVDRRCGATGACPYTSQALEGYLAARLLLQAVARAGPEIDAYSSDASESFEPARRAAREGLLQSIYDAGMYSFDKLRVGPYGGVCGNSAVVGARNLGCECNQGMHNVFLTEMVAGAPVVSPQGTLVTPYFFERRPEGDVFFESCGVPVDYRPQSEQPIVFGQSASFSGDTAGLGTGMQRGIRAAFSFANSLGGINGKEVRLVSFDDAYNPARAISNTKEALAAHRVFGYIGSTGTPTASAVFPLVTEAEVPWVGPLTGAGFLRSPFVPTIVNARASYTDECAAMTKDLVARGITKVAFFGQDDSFGGAGLSGITLSLRFHRLSLMVDSRYPKGTQAVHAGIVAMLSLPEPPEAVVMFGTSKPLGRFAAILRVTFDRLGYRQPLLYATSFVGARAFRQATMEAMAVEASTPVANYLDGLYVASVVPVPDDPGHPLVAAYQQDMRSAGLVTEGAPSAGQASKFEYESLEGWLVGRLTTMALQRSASSTRADFLKAFYTTSFFQVAAGSQALGPFVDGQCNQGMRSIWIITANANPGVATGTVGDFSLVNAYDFSALGCGVLAEYSKPPCPDGSERVSLSNDTQAFTCHKCARGFFSSGGAPCSECPAGSVAPDEGMPSCLKCGPGRFQDRPGQTACLNCDIFSFSTGEANAGCVACGPNALTFTEGATSRAACACNSGFFGMPSVEPDPAVLQAVRAGASPPPLPGADGSMEPVQLQAGSMFVPIVAPDGICRACPHGARCCRSDGEGSSAHTESASAASSSASSGSSGNVSEAVAALRCRSGTHTPLPLPGFVESTRLPATMVLCSPASACEGVAQEAQLNASQRCAPGYGGLHCGKCVEGYYNFYGVCNSCGTDLEAWGRAAGMLLFILVIVLSALELSSRKSTYTGLGLMLNSLQIGGLFNAIFARWPPMTDSFYAAAAVVTFRLDSFSPECKLQSLYPRDIFERQILWLVLPFGFAAVYIAIYGAVLALRACLGACSCKLRGRCEGYCGMLRMLSLPFPKLNATFISGFARLAISGYPVLVSHSLKTMQCVHLEDGTAVLDHSSGVRCYDDQWFEWLWTSVIGLLFYGVGIPAGLYLLIMASREAAAVRMAELKHRHRADRIVELVKLAKSPQAAEAAAAAAAAGGGQGLSAELQADAAGDLTDPADQRKGAGPRATPPRRRSSAGSEGGPLDLTEPGHGGTSVVGGKAAPMGAGRRTAGRVALSSASALSDSVESAGGAQAAGPAASTYGDLIDQQVEGSSAHSDTMLDRVVRVFGGGKKSHPEAAPADSKAGPDAGGRPAAVDLLQGKGRAGEVGGVRAPFEPSASVESDGSDGIEGGTYAPSSPVQEQVHLSRWRSSRRRSVPQQLGLRLGRIPTHAVLKSSKATPSVDVQLSARVRERALKGDEVVTHEELERWHEEDLKHARGNTSDILVDADHVLWPFIVDYREDAYYWALVEMAEFAVIVLASTFVTDAVSQMSVMLLAILAFMLAVLVCKPYRSNYFNYVELVNDSLQILSLIVGISYVREPRPLSEEASDAVLLLMITVNLISLTSSIFRDVADKVDEWKKRSFWKSWRVDATSRAAKAEQARRAKARESKRRIAAGKGGHAEAAARAKRTSIIVDAEDVVGAGDAGLRPSTTSPSAAADGLLSGGVLHPRAHHASASSAAIDEPALGGGPTDAKLSVRTAGHRPEAGTSRGFRAFGARSGEAESLTPSGGMLAAVSPSGSGEPLLSGEARPADELPSAKRTPAEGLPKQQVSPADADVTASAEEGAPTAGAAGATAASSTPGNVATGSDPTLVAADAPAASQPVLLQDSAVAAGSSDGADAGPEPIARAASSRLGDAPVAAAKEA
ncbi:hypothetical protein FNF27_07816 [Cafeteria roenbergensis]|uniref:Receptor ligand binding region domain-containing protein n=2 Tax=Cafeteria roenbergensis TaxID=33653 RepID=A0A5A8DFM3_CAFRO|nr:hypothetical protein FNF27_07816 [Cafeteria roenbergensis]